MYFIGKYKKHTLSSKGVDMKKSQAFAEILALKGIQPVKKIIDILLSIDNFNSDTLDKLNRATAYTEDRLITIEEIYVDLTYQRKLRLQAILNRLIESGGFDKEVAGHIDLAVRVDGRKFVWDGFHRVIKAGISGITHMPPSIYTHDKSLSVEKQVMKEAKMFKVRNADQSSMEPGEIFKSEIVFQDPTAMKILSLLKRCKLDVEGTNPDAAAISLGGFALLKKVWDKIDARHFEDSSNMIRQAFSEDKTMSVILWCGLAKLLETNDNDNSVTTASISSLTHQLIKTVKSDIDIRQKSFTQPRLHGKALESTARNLLRMGLSECYNDNGQEVNSMISYMGIDEDGFDE